MFGLLLDVYITNWGLGLIERRGMLCTVKGKFGQKVSQSIAKSEMRKERNGRE